MAEHGKQLAAWAAGLTWDALPQRIREKALDHVVDTVGVMFSGIAMEACAGARRAAAMWGCATDATVIGTGDAMPAATAAFLNALHARIHTYDDTYEPGTLHTGSPVISAALALAEREGADGRTFLAAVVAGYEIATRVAAAVSPSHYAHGFHNTGTCSVFGAAAAASRVLNFEAEPIAEALGLAGATAGGIRQHQIDGSMLDSAFHGARAAQSGVMVAQLRREGVKGPPAILEGPWGFCKVMAPECDLERLTSGLADTYEFEKTTIKPFPTCRFAHGPTEAALRLRREHDIDAGAVRAVSIETFRQSIEVSSRPRLQSSFDATVSHQYSVALALAKGKVELAAITGAAHADPHVLDLMSRVSVRHDEELERRFPKSWPHRVTIEMKDGARHTLTSEYPPGRETPVPGAVVDAKFLEQSAPYLGEGGAREALARLRALPDARDVRGATAALKGRSG
ncbi:MAG TPA: MmgE/PrpD family protein [Burkholderiales bacterium]|nr:MmgE/PrpD family protein [Burkholderiales bacterium]